MDQIISFIGTGVIPIFLIIIVAVLIVSYIGSRYKVAGANEALIVSGQRDRGPDGRRNLKVVRGGGVIVLPLIHKVGKLKLTARQINVNLADAVSRQGIKVAVQGVATFKIGADDESIRNAAERFLDAQEEQVDSIVKNVLEGSLRSIVGTLTVEELNLDRQKFQQAVQDAAKGDLATSGLQIDSFTIQAIRDESGYMELIGQQETARRERDARMAKAAADQEAAVREAEAEQIKINAARDVSLRRAETETQTAAANARAAQAGPLAEAEATQEVTRKQTELAELEAARTQKELLTSTVRPAEAEAEAQIRRAEGDKQARIAAAQADAERVKLAGEAQARVVEVTAEATAKQTTLEGNAEAGIVLSKGEAEAKALALRADAYRQFNEAAIIQTVLSQAAGDRPCGSRAHGQHRQPDRPVERGRIRRRPQRDPDGDRGRNDREGPDRDRHPGHAQPGDGWRHGRWRSLRLGLGFGRIRWTRASDRLSGRWPSDRARAELRTGERNHGNDSVRRRADAARPAPARRRHVARHAPSDRRPDDAGRRAPLRESRTDRCGAGTGRPGDPCRLGDGVASTDRHGGGPGPTGQDDLAGRPRFGRDHSRDDRRRRRAAAGHGPAGGPGHRALRGRPPGGAGPVGAPAAADDVAHRARRSRRPVRSADDRRAPRDVRSGSDDLAERMR